MLLRRTGPCQQAAACHRQNSSPHRSAPTSWSLSGLKQEQGGVVQQSSPRSAPHAPPDALVLRRRAPPLHEHEQHSAQRPLPPGGWGSGTRGAEKWGRLALNASREAAVRGGAAPPRGVEKCGGAAAVVPNSAWKARASSMVKAQSCRHQRRQRAQPLLRWVSSRLRLRKSSRLPSPLLSTLRSRLRSRLTPQAAGSPLRRG